MIDTVVLTLDSGEFKILDHNRFSPSTINLFEKPYYKLGGKAHFQCVQNPPKQDYLNGNYKPRLTAFKIIVRGGFATGLKIEFSAPKLIFGNNFDELSIYDFPDLVYRLRDKLLEMGVQVSVERLAQAHVTAIHYSKNIVLTDYTTSSMMINELSKVNLSQWLDLATTDFRNNGHALRYHSNHFELVFYDKIKDLEQAKKGDKRAIENQNSVQLKFFSENNFKPQLQVLCMEARYTSHKKIKELLSKLKIDVKPLSKQLFSMEIAQKVLLGKLLRNP